MGKVKHLESVREFFKKTPVVSSRDIKTFVRGKSYNHLLVSNMLKRGEIKRIKNGFYTTNDDPTLAVFCFKPAYIGLQDALSIHGLWEQETAVVIVTAKKVKRGRIEVFGNNVVLHRIKPKYIFGFDFIRQGDVFLPVSDLEKTFIDLFYFNEAPDKKLIQKLERKMNLKKLKIYLARYPKIFRNKILSNL